MEDAPPESLREYTRSRLPTYRHVDVAIKNNSAALPGSGRLDLEMLTTTSSSTGQLQHVQHSENAPMSPSSRPSHHQRFQSANNLVTNIATAVEDQDSPSPKLQRHLTFPASDPSSQAQSEQASSLDPKRQRARKNVLATQNRKPPPSMITQGYYNASTLSPTNDWVTQQSKQISQPPISHNPDDSHPPTPAASTSSRLSTLIKPIRGFKPSSRRQSEEMADRRSSQDQHQDSTLRALEGRDNPYSNRTNPSEGEEQNSDESDLFLRAAREEDMAQQIMTNGDAPPSRSVNRRSRIGQQALPSSTVLNSALGHRRGSDNDSQAGSHHPNEQEVIGQALTYHPLARDRPSAVDDINKSRYYGGNTRSAPNTPRNAQNREISPPESQVPYSSRRPSVPDASLPSRSYRQSNLSYSTPRTYNSSPLVSRTTDVHDTHETPRAAEGTESTVSTTAPSTVWDELEDLKSRIHRLELTGKLPTTSGAAISRGSNDRPPTATTTVTTMSSSPKRGRAHSISPNDPVTVDPSASEAHPLLQAALAKSKPLLTEDVYRALEAATSDALAISAMMGTSGQPGPMSSAQSNVGGPGVVSDRQVRRKADSMCRSLTELCLALTEGKSEGGSQALTRPPSRDTDPRMALEQNNTQRQLATTDLTRVKSSPRALSRLEARRSSLLATSTLPSPRYVPSDVGTPTSSSIAGRRTSLLLRGRRAGTEEPEEDEETRFRAPSRAVTEVNGLRNSPREYTSQQPLPERQSSIQSSLPVRRHYVPNSFTNTEAAPIPPVSGLGARRYLERQTPDRDTNSLVGRLAEDRGQRKSSISQSLGLGRTGSLNRRSRQASSADYTSTGYPPVGYQ